MKFLLLLLIIPISHEISMSDLQNSVDTDEGHIKSTETTISKMMMNTPIIRSIYGIFRLLANLFKTRKRSIRKFPPDLKVEENYDARKAYPECKTIIETITVQGNCNSCWAVAVATTFSDRICIHSKGEKKYHMSVQQMIACDRQNNGCLGGEMYTAWKFLEDFPLVTGGPYGSTGEEKGCQPYLIHSFTVKAHLKCSKRDCPTTHKAKDVITLPQDEYEIRREIQYYGPVSAMMLVYSSLDDYKGGVYQKKPKDTFVGPHFVRIIGWGVTEDEYKLKYWIVVNSTSKYWGDKGTFKILRGTNECNIESRVTSGLPDFYSPPNYLV